MGAVFYGEADDAFDVQITIGRCRGPDAFGLISHAYVQRRAVGIGIHGNAGDVHFAQCAHNAYRDFAAIGNENLSKHELKILAGHRRGLRPAYGIPRDE